jgi:hypothetical protein
MRNSAWPVNERSQFHHSGKVGIERSRSSITMRVRTERAPALPQAQVTDRSVVSRTRALSLTSGSARSEWPSARRGTQSRREHATGENVLCGDSDPHCGCRVWRSYLMSDPHRSGRLAGAPQNVHKALGWCHGQRPKQRGYPREKRRKAPYSVAGLVWTRSFRQPAGMGGVQKLRARWPLRPAFALLRNATARHPSLDSPSLGLPSRSSPKASEGWWT